MGKIVASLLLWIHLSAGAFVFDDLGDLQGKTVVFAGEFEQLDCPIGGKYDCMSWPDTLLRTSGARAMCFTTSRASCRYKCRGLIAVDANKNVAAYIIGQLSGDVTKASVEPIKCPTMY